MISNITTRGHDAAHMINAPRLIRVAPLPYPNLLPPARSAAEDDSNGR
jgi:hypothetical protein